MTMNLAASNRKTQLGFSLVEAMVALVVLSVGMIGAAALHGQGLGAGRSAQFRSVAINLAADIADRIRANRLAGVGYMAAGQNFNCDNVPPNTGGVDCTPAQMAAHDVFFWNQRVQNSLPNGTQVIIFNNLTNPPTYAITLSWDEVGQPLPATHQIALQLPTF